MSSPAALATLSYDVIVNSSILGPLTVSEDQILSFAGGLYGFPECRSFVVIAAQREGFYWLQSLDHEALAFLLADPFLFFDGYSVEVGATERAELAVKDSSEVGIFVIVTLPRTPGEPLTANLQGPIAINFASQRARQFALADSEYGVRCPIAAPGSSV